MARRCELTGKGVMSGHNVSHSNIKTNRRFLPNLQTLSLHSETLGRSIRLKVSMHALRSVEARGGLDGFLMNARDRNLSIRARRLKRTIARSQAQSATG
jgi:large subunit ribosomal protein L28